MLSILTSTNNLADFYIFLLNKHTKVTLKRMTRFIFLDNFSLIPFNPKKCFAVGLVIPCLYKTIKSCVFSTKCYLSPFVSILVLCTAAQICSNNVLVISFYFSFAYLQLTYWKLYLKICTIFRDTVDPRSKVKIISYRHIEP